MRTVTADQLVPGDVILIVPLDRDRYEGDPLVELWLIVSAERAALNVGSDDHWIRVRALRPTCQVPWGLRTWPRDMVVRVLA